MYNCGQVRSSCPFLCFILGADKERIIMSGQIKLIDKNTDLSNIKPLDWDVNIKGRPYYSARIDGYVHSIGGHWGENDYWCWPRDEQPTHENLMQFAGSPCRWGFRVDDNNYIRNKYDAEVLHNHYAVITRNGEDFYSFAYGGLGGAVAKAQILIDEFEEHPIWPNEIDFDKKVIGRKVWWSDFRASVRSYIKGQACVMLVPDGEDKFPIPKCYGEDDICCDEREEIKTEIFDKNIWWFRD